MTQWKAWRTATGLLALVSLSACSRATGGSDDATASGAGAMQSAPADSAAAADSVSLGGAAMDHSAHTAASMDHSAHGGAAASQTHQHGAPAESIKIPPDAMYSVADVQFMQGMIAHHAQAISMAKLAPTHEAGPQLLRFAQKINLSQRAEIELMQNWLRERGQMVPDSTSEFTMIMPGMITAEQMKQLDATKGRDFDRLFLTFMIQHHEGALTMVADLLGSPMAAQEPDISQFANDVETDQRAEIARMHAMLENM